MIVTPLGDPTTTLTLTNAPLWAQGRPLLTLTTLTTREAQGGEDPEAHIPPFSPWLRGTLRRI